jgi:hypothetical protein
MIAFSLFPPLSSLFSCEHTASAGCEASKIVND